jgi:hypothetical protein
MRERSHVVISSSKRKGRMMLTEVKRVGILRAGTLGAILYGFLGVLMLPLALIAVIADPVEGLMFGLMVVSYPLMGFLGCLIAAALYNLAARIAGGFQMELETVPEPRADVYPGNVTAPSA